MLQYYLKSAQTNFKINQSLSQTPYSTKYYKKDRGKPLETTNILKKLKKIKKINFLFKQEVGGTR